MKEGGEEKVTEWRNEGKSKQQIKDDIENFIIKENIEERKVKDCYINKDQVLVEMEEWSGKEGNREDIHRQ
jgi:hypothetical protein